MDAPIAVGLVGYGLIGRTHAQALAAVDGARLAGIASRRGHQPDDEVPGLDGVRWFTSQEALHSGCAPDIVAICSPSSLHGAQTRTALEHDADVFVEKPPAGTVAELRELMSLARSRDRRLAVVSQNRVQPQLTYVADVIHGGRLGAPRLGEVRLHWHRPQTYYEAAPWRADDPHGGSLPNQGWHAVDLLTWFLGPADTVTGQVATLAHRIAVEDTVVSTVRFRNGALGSIVTTTTTPPGEPTEITLFFERGMIRIRDTRVVEWSAPDDVPPPPAHPDTGSGASDPAAIGADSHRRQWQDLVDAIRSGEQPAVSAADSLPTLALIEAIYTSAETGRATAADGGDS